MDNFDYSIEEAEELIIETAEEMLEGDSWDACDVMMDNLGLEPDYMLDVLEFIR